MLFRLERNLLSGTAGPGPPHVARDDVIPLRPAVSGADGLHNHVSACRGFLEALHACGFCN